MAEKNSLWKNIRNKAAQNRRTGAKPKEPSEAMLEQERKIKAKKAEGGYIYADGGSIPKGWKPLTAAIAKGRYSGDFKGMYYRETGDSSNPYNITYFDTPVIEKKPPIIINRLEPKRITTIPTEEIPLSLKAFPKEKVYINRGVNSGFDANGNPLVSEINRGSNKGWEQVPYNTLDQYEEIKAYGGNINQQEYKYGGTMKKFKKKYWPGGDFGGGNLYPTAPGMGVNPMYPTPTGAAPGTAGPGGGVDAGGASSLMGGANVGMQAYQANSQAIDMGQNFALGLMDDNDPYKDFMAQEMKRSNPIAKINPLLGTVVSMIGAKKRKEKFDKGVAEKKQIENNNIMAANDLSGYAQDAAVTFAYGGPMPRNASQAYRRYSGKKSYAEGGLTDPYEYSVNPQVASQQVPYNYMYSGLTETPNVDGKPGIVIDDEKVVEKQPNYSGPRNTFNMTGEYSNTTKTPVDSETLEKQRKAAAQLEFNRVMGRAGNTTIGLKASGAYDNAVQREEEEGSMMKKPFTGNLGATINYDNKKGTTITGGVNYDPFAPTGKSTTGTIGIKKTWAQGGNLNTWVPPDEELLNMGYSPEQIKAIKLADKQAPVFESENDYNLIPQKAALAKERKDPKGEALYNGLRQKRLDEGLRQGTSMQGSASFNDGNPIDSTKMLNQMLADEEARPTQTFDTNWRSRYQKRKKAQGGPLYGNSYAQGGSLTEIQGPSHEDGGVELTNQAEAEGGEVKADDYILSNRLGDKNGTFADQMKKEIRKGSPLRDSQNDNYSKFRIKNKRNQLVALNEQAIADMENIMMSEASGESPQAMMAMGGYLKKRKLVYGGPGRRRRASSSYTGSVPLATSLSLGKLPGEADMTTQEIRDYANNLYAQDFHDEMVALTDYQGWGSATNPNRPLTEQNARYLEDYIPNTPLNVDNPVNPATAITEEEATLHGWDPGAPKLVLDGVGTSNMYRYPAPQPPGPYREGVSGVSNTPLTREEAGWTQPPMDNLQSLRLSGYPDNLELPNNQPSTYNGPTNFGPITQSEDQDLALTDPYQDEIDYTVLPDEPLKGVSTSNLYSPNTTNAPVGPAGKNKTSKSVFGASDLDYLSMGVGALGSLSQIAYGLKGPDKVRDAKLNLARASKLNYTPSKRLASQEIDTAFNAADNDLRNNAPGAGSYLSNRIASAVKRAGAKGSQNAKLSEAEANANAQIQNQFNQYNSGVLNQQEQLNLAQEDKRIQEKDYARMAVTEGLDNFGQHFSQGVRDKRAYDWQELMGDEYLGSKNYITGEDGKRYFINNQGKMTRRFNNRDRQV